jgi:transcriptional regulator with XRE-family HTH domain
MKVINSKNDIKALIIKEGFSIKEVAEKISIITGENISQQNLNNKINRNQLRYSDILLLAEILGYDIEWIKNVYTEKEAP